MRFEIQVEAKDLFRFNMYHIYHTFSGVLGMVISIAALVGAVLTYGTVNTTSVSYTHLDVYKRQT